MLRTFLANHVHKCRPPPHRTLGAIVLLLLVAGPAWSVERGVTLPDQPRIERFTTGPSEAAQQACATLHTGDTIPKRRPLVAVTHDKTLPAALYGLLAGARYVTGPLQHHAAAPAAVPAGTTKAQAIANWRRCLNDATLRT